MYEISPRVSGGHGGGPSVNLDGEGHRCQQLRHPRRAAGVQLPPPSSPSDGRRRRRQRNRRHDAGLPRRSPGVLGRRQGHGGGQNLAPSPTSSRPTSSPLPRPAGTTRLTRGTAASKHVMIAIIASWGHAPRGRPRRTAADAARRSGRPRLRPAGPGCRSLQGGVRRRAPPTAATEGGPRVLGAGSCAGRTRPRHQAAVSCRVLATAATRPGLHRSASAPPEPCRPSAPAAAPTGVVGGYSTAAGEPAGDPAKGLRRGDQSPLPRGAGTRPRWPHLACRHHPVLIAGCRRSTRRACSNCGRGRHRPGSSARSSTRTRNTAAGVSESSRAPAQAGRRAKSPRTSTTWCVALVAGTYDATAWVHPRLTPAPWTR